MKFIVPWFGSTLPEEYRKRVDISRAVVVTSGHLFELQLLPGDYIGIQATIEKDKHAFNLAVENPDIAVLDADIELQYIPEMPEDKPYFSLNPKGNPHCAYFAVNGCCDFFREMEKKRIARGIQYCYNWPGKILRREINNVGIIPDDSYVHHMLTFNKRRTHGSISQQAI